MRRIAVGFAALAVAACASIGAPPGGPTRTTPPKLLRVSPESGAVNVNASVVSFDFDVVVSDPGDRLVLLSPREGEPRITWKRDRIEVRPRRGFRPNTAYTATLLPGLTDQRGNAMTARVTTVFSTGPTMPRYAVYGRVFDWLSERIVPNAVVEIIRRPDSLTYVAVTDSAGQFSAGPLDEGRYTVRTLIDNNRNQTLDVGEAWDSIAVEVKGTSPFVELLAAQRDTSPPRLLIVTASDSLTLQASFDRPLDPTAPLTPEAVRVVSADSTPLRVVRVLTRAAADAERRSADSVARRDSARRDSAGARAAISIPRIDSLATPRPSRPAPPRDLVIRLDPTTPLRTRATYRITVLNARGLTGRSRTSDRMITIAAPPPRDTTRPPAAAVPRP